jgi:methylene-tetrahydromethanopterin dehydrogenase
MSERKSILHMFTPSAQMSPFDVNIAVDAGYDVVVPYAHVGLAEISGLVQDAIFSRGPKGVRRTGVFIGGRDTGLADDMLTAARKAMVPPFEVSVFADPSGAFTTAGAMVACTERLLDRHHGTSWQGLRVAVLGGTGPVGAAAATLAARAGASVCVASHSDLSRAQAVAKELERRYQVRVAAGSSSAASDRAALLADAQVVLACAKAGVQVASVSDLAGAKRLLVAADVNAVPPEGVAGVGVVDNGKPLAAGSGKALGLGALAIGNVKYQTEKGLFETMLSAEKPVYLDLQAAFETARRHVG